MRSYVSANEHDLPGKAPDETDRSSDIAAEKRASATGNPWDELLAGPAVYPTIKESSASDRMRVPEQMPEIKGFADNLLIAIETLL